MDLIILLMALKDLSTGEALGVFLLFKWIGYCD